MVWWGLYNCHHADNPTGTFSAHCSVFLTKSLLAATMGCGGTAGFPVRGCSHSQWGCIYQRAAVDKKPPCISHTCISSPPHSSIVVCMYSIRRAALLGTPGVEFGHRQAKGYRYPLMDAILPHRYATVFCSGSGVCFVVAVVCFTVHQQRHVCVMHIIIITLKYATYISFHISARV